MTIATADYRVGGFLQKDESGCAGRRGRGWRTSILCHVIAGVAVMLSAASARAISPSGGELQSPLALAGEGNEVIEVDRVSVRSGAWEDPMTWSPTGVPGATDDVRIVADHTIAVRGFKRAGSLFIGPGARLTATADAPDLEIWVEHATRNEGEVSAADADDGGHTILRTGSNIRNTGVIRAGHGRIDGFGR